jgi:hypothetical protein
MGLLFNNVAMSAWSSSGSIPVNATPGTLAHTLLSADPTAAGTSEATNELAYTGYNAGARPTLTTSGTTGYTLGSNGAVSNAASVTWGACTALTATASYMGIGNAASGTGYLLMAGAVTTPLAIAAGITPSAAIGAITITLS